MRKGLAKLLYAVSDAIDTLATFIWTPNPARRAAQNGKMQSPKPRPPRHPMRSDGLHRGR